VKIQLILQKDLLSILEIYNSFFIFSPKSEKKFSMYFKNRFLGFYLTNNKQIIGFIWGRFIDKNFNLNTLWISPIHRKQGCAKMLLEILFEKIKYSSSETEKVFLHFRKQNELEKFYSKFGFNVLKTTENYSNGDLKISMEKYL